MAIQVEIERLNQEQEMALEKRKSEFETELEDWHLLDERELTLSEQELPFAQRDQSGDFWLAELASKEEALSGRSDELKEEERKLLSHRQALLIELLKEKEEIQKMKLDLEKEKAFFEEVKREAIQAQQDLAITQAERDSVLTLQMDLKNEIDNLRAQQKELMADADWLQAEKERFEINWELIDEKKEELQKEAARIAEEQRVISEHLKNQSDIIKQEKENLRAQFKINSETLLRINQVSSNKRRKIDSEDKQLSLSEVGKSKMNGNGLLPCGEDHHATPPNDLAFTNGKVGDSDFVDDDEPSEDITVSATKPSTGLIEGRDKQDEDADGEEEDEEEEKTSPAKKLWRFLIT